MGKTDERYSKLLKDITENFRHIYAIEKGEHLGAIPNFEIVVKSILPVFVDMKSQIDLCNEHIVNLSNKINSTQPLGDPVELNGKVFRDASGAFLYIGDSVEVSFNAELNTRYEKINGFILEEENSEKTVLLKLEGFCRTIPLGEFLLMYHKIWMVKNETK